MNRIVRTILMVLLLGAYSYVLAFAVLWNERRNVRGEKLELSGWGILFIVGGLILLAGIWLAIQFARNDYNGSAITIAIVDAVIATLGIVKVAPEVSWTPSLRLLGAIAVAVAFVSAHIYLAVSDRH